MSDPNITRSQARDRSNVVAAISYRVNLDFSGDSQALGEGVDPSKYFVSTSEVTFDSREGGTSHIDLIADEVLAVSLDGVELFPGDYANNRFQFWVEAGSHVLSITARYLFSNSGEGVHRFLDPADDRVYLYSQFEAADARRAFACFDQPDQKAKFTISVLAPLEWSVFSNSASVEPVDQGQEIGLWSFAETQPIATYVTAIVAGPYYVDQGTISAQNGVLPAAIVCRQSTAQYLDADRIRATTQAGFEVFEKHFDYPYPFDSYDQIFVPEFNFGAMENVGCVTFRDEYLFRSRVTSREYEARDNTILHELAHMWFGDLVTMRWWDDLWLNESFAEWASHFCQAELAEADPSRIDPWVSFANERKTWAYAEDQLPTTHPIAADMVDLEAVEQNFDGITYAKGASVLKLLVSLVGQGEFLAGVRRYFATYAFGNTELKDLLHELQIASGRDLSWFSTQWLETSGVNTFSADFDVDDQGNFTRFDLLQSADPAYPTIRTHRIGIGILTLVDGVLTRTHRLDVDASYERTPIAALVGQPRGDLVLLNDGDLTYAKIRMDEKSLATAVEHLADLDDDLARALVWAITWDMTRDGELAPQDYVRLVTGALGTETDQTAVTAVLRQATTAATLFTAPELRHDVRGELVTGLAKLLKHAEPGTDGQVSIAKALARSVFTPTGADLLLAWLRGEEVPAGLPIDTDMRWILLGSLARLGVIEEQHIAAEAEHDRTSAGAEKAAGVIAALADAEAKAEAWQLATADPSVPNETHRQICMQFFSFDQEELLLSYRDQYLDVLTLISDKQGDWASRGTAAREAVLEILPPRAYADADYVAKVQAWLDERERSAQVTRSVREFIDGAQRALRCQERSRQAS